MLMSAERKGCVIWFIHFFIFLRQGITVPSCIIVGYAWRILGRGSQNPPSLHPWAAPSWIGLIYCNNRKELKCFSLSFVYFLKIHMRKRNIFGNTWRLVLKLSNGLKKLDLRFKDFNFPVNKLTKSDEVYVSCFNYTWFKFIALYWIKL